jgi:hypothetical protein
MGGNQGRRRVSALTIVLAILVAAGLVGLIAWQAAPWLIESGTQETSKPPAPPQTAQQQPPAIEKPRPGGSPQPPAATPDAAPPESTTPQAPAPTPAPAVKPEAEEPVPEPPKPAEQPRPKPERKMTQQRRPPAEVLPQAIGVVTSPAGALAALDGHSSNSCRTPCTLTAPPGRHFIEVTQAGYQTEHREVEVTAGPQDLPPIVLRVQGGALMVSSDPPGASITVNGKLVDKVTPAQLNLAPGTYTVVIAKDGKSASRTIQMQNGAMKTLKVDFRAE